VKGGIIIALLLVLVSLAGTACQRSVSIPAADQAATAETIVSAPTDSAAATRAAVYYFHRTIRCETCLKFEALTEKALRGGFARELANGRLTWRVVDFEEPQNEPLTSKYDVFESSVVVSRLVGETEVEWKKLEDIWGLVGDENAFIGYIQEEVGGYLGGAAHGQ
jgi:hypothetical protein